MDNIKSIVYGIGGYDETKPNNNLVETLYYTEAELAEEEAKAAAQAQAEAAKAAAQAKLAALGLTADDLAALGL